jgi:hypothetical protein
MFSHHHIFHTKGLHFQRLLKWYFLPVKTHDDDCYQHITHVITNCTQLASARKYFFDLGKGLLPQLAPLMSSPNAVRRLGVLNTIKFVF